MSKTTRKRIWPAALMSLAVFGLLATAVVFSTMQPQSAQAHECDSSTMSADEFAACERDHRVAGLDGSEDHNHPPMAKGSIAAVTVTAGMATDAMDVSGYFEDTDEGDTLTYRAASSDDSVATAAIGDGLFNGGGSMLTITGVAAGDATITVTADDGNGGTAMQEIMVTVMAPEPDAPDMISNSSTSGGAGVELILTIQSLPMDAVDGTSVELFLEDDFQVPDTIDRGSVYFTVPDGGEDQNDGGRVYAQYAVEVDDDDHYGGDDDWSIRVFIPDMNNADNSGYDGPTAGQTVKLVITKAAGVKNPTEAGTHSVGYKVLGPNDEPNETDDIIQLGTVATLAKISLSDEDAGRGKEITITGTGFNNGTGAEVFVLVADTKPESCMALVTHDDAESLGTASVGSDDKFVVTYTVHQDEFDAGPVNHICAVDSEAGNPRFSSDIDTFDLEASVTVSPDSANFGDEVTVKPRDFVDPIASISLGPTCAWTAASGDDDCFDVDRDGSDFVFDLPGGLDERIQIAVTDGDQTKRIYMGVVASTLTLSQDEVAPNASIIISGSGFTQSPPRAAQIRVSDITIDGEPLVIDDAGTVACRDGVSGDCVAVTSSGEFTATVRVWTASGSPNNPTLDDDTYTIEVVDQGGFEGEVDITIAEPTINVNPDTASPRDFIVISGENWPISTPELDNFVTIEVDGRTRTADVDSTGRFRYEYQLRASIKIGEEHDITVTYEDPDDRDDIEEDTTFNVTQAELSIMPAAAAPGQTITVEIQGMPPYALVDDIIVGRVDLLGNQSITTNREGDATASGLIVPFLDPGHYPVTVKVDTETRVGQLEVLAEAAVPGVAATLPDAVSDLGDNLEAIFHFNNTSKEWTFFDPRPEFADLNTLTELNSGQPYWVLVGESQEDVEWNGRLVSFTCAADDCWNLEIW